MAIENMKLLCVSAFNQEQNNLIDEAIEKSCYHPVLSTQIVHYTNNGVPASVKNDFTDVLARIDHLNKALQLGIQEVSTYKEVSIEDVKEIVSRVEKRYETYLNDRGRKSTDDDLKALKNLEKYDYDVGENDYITIRFGRIPLSTIGDIVKYNEEKFVYTELNRDKYYVWLVYVCLREDREHFDELFKNFYFEAIPIPNRFQETEHEQDLNELYSYVKYKAQQESFLKYIVYDHDLCKFYAFVPYDKVGEFKEGFNDDISINEIDLSLDYPEYDLDKLDYDPTHEYYFGRLSKSDYALLQDKINFITVNTSGDKIYVVYGTTPGQDLNIRKILEKTDFAYGLMDIKFSYDESGELIETGDRSANKKLVVPTKLKNNWLFKPFEMLVEMYGIPVYGTFDPTVFFGISYCLLFGIMFGDVGQGLVIWLIGYYMYHKRHMILGAIMERIGVVSAFFGFIYGSVFGNEEILLPLLKPLGLPIHVGSSEMTMPLLISAVGLGVVLILISMFINIIVLLKQKRYAKALFHQNGLSGFIFYGYLIVAVILMVLGINIINPINLIIFVGLPLLTILLAEPLSHMLVKKKASPESGWGGYLVESSFELFEVILSFLTNTMSFLRVAGFVLSHVGMMMVVMQLHEMSGNAGILVMVFGNVLVIALEGLIVGIQTLRLEYYEMFSRYYESGGVKFKSI